MAFKGKPRKVRRRYVRTTHEQQQGLERIKERLALQGFQIFPVARRFRRHRLDFVALWRGNPQKMLLVQPAWGGVIQLRPYQQKSAYTHVWNRVRKGREELPKVVWGKLLPARDNINGWRRFIPEGYETALSLFTNAH